MTKKENENGLDGLIKSLRRPQAAPKPRLGISSASVLKARKASKLGATIGQIAKALKVSYPTAWKAVKAIPPYDQVK